MTIAASLNDLGKPSIFSDGGVIVPLYLLVWYVGHCITSFVFSIVVVLTLLQCQVLEKCLKKMAIL
jgi:hypothetical protein